MKKIYKIPESLRTEYFLKNGFHYCPGCGHSIIHRLIAECVDELGIKERTFGFSPVGCSVFWFWYTNFISDNFNQMQCAHGRAPASATGARRADDVAKAYGLIDDLSILITYQGDGDLGAIGAAEILHAAIRGENISAIFVNNATYGMTGNQMAPTTVLGQKTTTTPYGRDEKLHGNPVKMCELLATLERPAYLERTAVTSTKHIIKTKKAIKKSLENQINEGGFSMVEILSPCPSGRRLRPLEERKWVEENLFKVFPLGVYRDITKEK